MHNSQITKPISTPITLDDISLAAKGHFLTNKTVDARIGTLGRQDRPVGQQGVAKRVVKPEVKPMAKDAKKESKHGDKETKSKPEK